jgi:DNA-binding IclR family transcriptional regulator
MKPMTKDDTDAAGGIQVIARSAAILRSLAGGGGMSLAQIAHSVDLPRSTVQRIVAALIEERLVLKTGAQGGFRLGPGLQALAEDARLTTVETCRPILADIAAATSETVDLSVLRGGAMIFIDQVPGTHRLRTVSAVGDRFPLVNTANGLACLAALRPEQAAPLIHADLSRAGNRIRPDAVLKSLETVRETGLAYDRDAHTEGISAVGIAFRDLAGDMHSISVPIPTSRFDKVLPVVSAALSDARNRIRNFMEV